MDIRVNDTLWHIQFKKPTSSELRRSDGTISLGVTDNTTKTVTIADNVSDYMADKILCHELVHVYSFSYGCDIDIETEEIIADFMSLYGRNIVYTADKIFYWSKNMDKIDRLLEYIHRTNPEMTRQKLIEELGESDYSAKSIYFLAIQNSNP